MESTPVMINTSEKLTYLRGEALVYLRMLKAEMALGNLTIGSKIVKLPSGYMAECSSCFGIDEVTILGYEDDVEKDTTPKAKYVTILIDAVGGALLEMGAFKVVPSVASNNVSDCFVSTKKLLNIKCLSNNVGGSLVKNPKTLRKSILSECVGSVVLDTLRYLSIKILSNNVCKVLALVQAAPVAKITWATPAAIQYSTVISAVQLNATANIPGTFTYDPPLGAVLDVGERSLTVEFTPNDPTVEAIGAEVWLTVNKMEIQLTWSPAPVTYHPTVGLQTYTLPQYKLQNSGGVTIEGINVYHTPGVRYYNIGDILNAGTYIAECAYANYDTTRYTVYSVAANLVVNKADQAALTVSMNPAVEAVGMRSRVTVSGGSGTGTYRYGGSPSQSLQVDWVTGVIVVTGSGWVKVGAIKIGDNNYYDSGGYWSAEFLIPPGWTYVCTQINTTQWRLSKQYSSGSPNTVSYANLTVAQNMALSTVSGTAWDFIITKYSGVACLTGYIKIYGYSGSTYWETRIYPSKLCSNFPLTSCPDDDTPTVPGGTTPPPAVITHPGRIYGLYWTVAGDTGYWPYTAATMSFTLFDTFRLEWTEQYWDPVAGEYFYMDFFQQGTFSYNWVTGQITLNFVSGDNSAYVWTHPWGIAYGTSGYFEFWCQNSSQWKWPMTLIYAYG